MKANPVERTVLAVAAAQRLADTTSLLVRSARETVHAARNARQHASLLRMLVKLLREARRR